jgi:hypothetical protein
VIEYDELFPKLTVPEYKVPAPTVIPAPAVSVVETEPVSRFVAPVVACPRLNELPFAGPLIERFPELVLYVAA